MSRIPNEENQGGQELIDFNDDSNLSIPHVQLSSKKHKKSNYIKISKQYIYLLPFIALIIIIIYFAKSPTPPKRESLKLIKTKNLLDFDQKAGEIIKQVIKENSRATISLSSGTGVKGTYKWLIDENIDNNISFEFVKVVNFDEFYGEDENSIYSHNFYLRENFINHINIRKNNIHLIPGTGVEATKAAEDYNNIIKKNGIDISVINIEDGGRFGFYREGESADNEMHVVRLDKKTRRDLSKEFDYDINKTPQYVITQGIKNVVKSKNILVIAKGKDKAKAVKAIMKGIPDPKIPLTLLLNTKGNIFIVADKDACSLL